MNQQNIAKIGLDNHIKVRASNKKEYRFVYKQERKGIAHSVWHVLSDRFRFRSFTYEPAGREEWLSPDAVKKDISPSMA